MTWSWENELQCESCLFDSDCFTAILKVGKLFRDNVVESKYTFEASTRTRRQHRRGTTKTSTLGAKVRALPYKLLSSEVVQIVNTRPRDLTEFGVCVEEADMRFSKEELKGILKLVTESLQEGAEVNRTNGVNGVGEVNGTSETQAMDVS
jgi:hypothetical protein